MADRKKVYTYSSSNGCLTNLMDSTHIRKSLNNDYYENCESPDLADVIIINTCGYNQDAENRSVQVIENLKKDFPTKQIIATGCLPRINKEVLQNKFQQTVLSHSELEVINQKFDNNLLSKDKPSSKFSEIDNEDIRTRMKSNQILQILFPKIKSLSENLRVLSPQITNIMESAVFDRLTYALTISTGCLGKCNYCAIKKAKGSLLSKSLPEIIDNINLALKKGYNRIHLLADDVGCWGQDIGLNSSHLLSAIMNIKADFKLVINYFDPTWLVEFYDDLKKPLTDPRLICINIPLQSGDDATLAEMDRQYKSGDVIERVEEIKRLNPNLAIKTHIMVGYPGESWLSFWHSLQKAWFFHMVFPNKYDIRPGTPAAKKIQLAGWIKTIRFQVLKFAIFFIHCLVLFKSIRPYFLNKKLVNIREEIA